MAMFELVLLHRAQFVSALGRLELSWTQALTLKLLEPGRPAPMSTVACGLSCDASNVTGIVDRLEARGLVERRSDERDRRVKKLALTEAGVRVRRQVLTRLHEPPGAITSLPLEEQVALRDLLRRALGA